MYKNDYAEKFFGKMHKSEVFGDGFIGEIIKIRKEKVTHSLPSNWDANNR
jgi:hypothetical protein